MQLAITLRNYLRDPRLRSVDVNSADLISMHRRILEEKPMMKKVFSEFYDLCIDLDTKYFSGEGKRVEIGAGSSFFKKRYPEVISTDIKPGDGLDMVVDAQRMLFEDASVRAIYGIHCFHHLPRPTQFLNELERVLVPGGGCVLIDPYFGFVANRFYRVLCDTETFNPNQPYWENESLGYMANANQALSYIIFKRDRGDFQRMFPQLELVMGRPLNNYLRYLLSGGVNFRQLVPDWTTPAIKALETLLIPLNRILALHHVLVIRRKAT
jgi:predicted SAM-dependent methyltransferase